MASENLSDEEYLDSLLEKVSGDKDGKKSSDTGKRAANISDSEMEAEAERRVQELLEEGLNDFTGSTYQDVSMEQIQERERAIARGEAEGGLLDGLTGGDDELLASLDSIVQEIKKDSPKEEPQEEEAPKKAKKKKKSKGLDKLKNIFFKVEVVDPVKEEEEEQEKREKKKQAKAKKAEDQKQAKSEKAEEKKAADAVKKEQAQAKKAEKAKLREEKKAKKAEQKAQREPEERIKLKPAFMLFLVSVIAVMTMSVMLLSDNYAYGNAMNTAQRNFVNHRYKEAYETLSGMKIKEQDQMFYDQVRLLMRLERQYDAYVNYSHLEMPKEALHALLQGMTIYYENMDYVEAYNLVSEAEEQKETLLYSLNNDFGIDEDRARQICEMEDTNDYTREVELYSANYLQ